MEDKIRRHLGEEIIKRVDLPIEIKGSVLYNENLHIGTYRRYIPTGDNVETIYLTMKELFPSYRITEVFLEFLRAKDVIDEFADKEEYEECERLQKKLNQGLLKLVELLKQ